MESDQNFPKLENFIPDLESFVRTLTELYHAGKITSWEDLEKQVHHFFTPSKMEQMESIIPGWCKMASYSDGITLVHVMCVFLGMYLLPEFQHMSVEQQDLMKWVILFHDIDKVHIRGKRDTMHAFRSGVVAANRLPGLGFSSTKEYPDLIQSWSEFTIQAFLDGGEDSAPIPDNQKLPRILQGIEQLFGQNTPAALITKTVLLHISLHVVKEYPTPAPLGESEVRRFIDLRLFPLLRVLMLSDNEGWCLFDQETRKRQKKETLAAFEKVHRLLS